MTKARDLASSGLTLTATTTTADAALAKAGGTMTGNLAMGTNLVDGVDVSARDAVLTDTTTKATAALPKSGGAMTGAITTNSTFDGVDIATRDAVLSSTVSTATNALNNANNALPKEGGAMSGAITTNSTFDGVDVGARDSVLTSTTTTANAALPKAGGTMTGDLTTTGLTVTGDDIILDSSSQAFLKLDKGASSNFSLTRHYTAGTENWRTGTYDDGTNYVIGTPSAKKLSITTGGDVGIGTATPSTDITKFGGSAKGLSVSAGQPVVAVRASGNAQHVGYIGQVGTATFIGAVGGGNLNIQTGTNGTTKVSVGATGNVGIGVSDPDSTLDISGGSNKLGILRVTQRASGASAYGLDVGLDPSTGDPVFSRIVNDTVTEAFRIQRSSGNVGIGTAAPLRQLHISNTSANSEIAFTAGTSGTSSLLFGDGLTGSDIYRGYIQYQHNGDYMLLATSATVRARLDADGLKFNADTAAANGLNDYEEGSATLTWSGTGGTANTESTTWNYVKIGSLVTVSGNTSSGLPNATGTIVLTGLPFACNRNGTGSILYRQLNAPSGMHTMVAFVQSGTTQIMPFWSGSNAYVQLSSSDFNANGAQDMYMTVSYYTTA
jgi:hypothetical protein